MNKHRPIALIGFVGSGKTVVGGLLASHLGLPFSDLDGHIENLVGKRIPEILDTVGEEPLRQFERLALSSLSASGGVVAANASCIMFPKNRKIFAQSFTTVYLHADFETLFSRVAATSRSIVMSLTPFELQKLYELRQPLYEDCADIITDASLDPEEIVNDIIKQLHDGGEL